MPPLGAKLRPPAAHHPIYAPVTIWTAIDARARAENLSRSELVVRVVADFLASRRPTPQLRREPEVDR